jgi:hypothetical protein
MSTREWKPGDVAMIDHGATGQVVAVRTDLGGWACSRRGSDGKPFHHEGDLLSARPLVVIDPEDREQVERLVQAWERQAGESAFSTTGRYLQAALREFANPTPPRPEEPTGLGAVVEDAEGRLWFRMTIENQTWAGEVWQEQYGGDEERWSKWSAIDAVRILSEGVTP